MTFVIIGITRPGTLDLTYFLCPNSQLQAVIDSIKNEGKLVDGLIDITTTMEGSGHPKNLEDVEQFDVMACEHDVGSISGGDELRDLLIRSLTLNFIINDSVKEQSKTHEMKALDKALEYCCSCDGFGPQCPNGIIKDLDVAGRTEKELDELFNPIIECVKERRNINV